MIGLLLPGSEGSSLVPGAGELATPLTSLAAGALPARSELPAAEPEPEPEPAAVRADCERRILAATSEPALPGALELEENRAHVFLYAKSEPVVFVRPPVVDPHGTRNAATYRALLSRSKSPFSLLQRKWPVFSANQPLARQVLLREGYLYADQPLLAFAMVDLVAAQLLFSDERIWIHRGERILHAERSRTGHYVFVDGPERGQRVRLVLFDRVGTGEPPPPLHRDFRSLRRRLGFDRVKVLHLGESAVVAELRYGSIWAQSLLRSEGARLELECEIVTPGQAEAIAAARAVHARRERVLEPLRDAMLAQVEEGLPFDEPHTEYGQQDGALRRRWIRAYLEGKSHYEFNDDRYYVFNGHGRPLVPQVCVDFIFDTFERASGTWWRERGQPRERVLGKLDFGTNEDETLRRGTSIVDLAASRPNDFSVQLLPERERIPFKYSKKLADYLLNEAQHYEPGDIVVIRGYAPWDKPWKPKIMHVHTFFVYESDPVTGFPLALVGNPGRPLLQTWQFEAFRTPERSIWYRIRPELSFLERSLVPRSSGAHSELPPVLTTERQSATSDSGASG